VNFDLLPKVKAVVVSAAPRAAGEESDLVISIGLDCTDVPIEGVAGALRCDVDEARNLFDKDGNGYLPNLKYIAAKEGWKKKHDVKIGTTKRVRVMSVTGIKITPRANFLSDMHLVVTVEAPPAGYVEEVVDELQNSAWIELRQVEAELALEGGGNDDSAETQEEMDLPKKPRGRPKKDATD
jgi:hypothetical protein